MELATKIIQLYQLKQKTIGFAESMTGGSLAYHLVRESSASKVFKGSLVVYSNEAKTNILNISHEKIQQFGVVSKEIAKEMALSCQKQLNVDISVAVTGFAEGDIQEVYVAFRFEQQEVEVEYYKFDNMNRQEAILRTTEIVYEALIKQLK